MRIPHVLLMSILPLFLFSQNDSNGGYDGEVQTIEQYSTVGDTKESFKTIWYCTGIAVYQSLEIANFDSHKIAFNSTPFADISFTGTENMLASLGIQTGMYHGKYYPIKAKKIPDNIQNTYIAYIGIPLEVFDVKVDFLGAGRQYKFSYPLKPAREERSKYAYFRIPSGNYKDEEDFRITADVSPQRVNIRAVYNKQVLVLTLTPHQSMLLGQLTKLGLAEKPIITIKDSTAKLVDE